ncbi:hypothetical protein [Haloarcula sp. 1CSR25-25]|uniref:hypothetical protein n=1 Tax=Haloarcula sp. 1CSR25-25 TaxID=2862545 RepID=UPI002895BFCD|nr:hypothetical protein [Haloarcula sp. 1CSR25-25]MDT3434257.1 hypothetical protein [Haloarcula sp. 1CSR25-25]
MYPRGGDNVARHFYHENVDIVGGCEYAGESDVHHRCKALALAALKEQFGTMAYRYGVEEDVDVAFTPDGPDRRTADVLLEFDSRNRYFGTGLVIEVQHRNKDKDLRKVTYDYVSADYSVAWLGPQHFDEESLDWDVMNELFATYKQRHDWQGGEPIDVGHAISVRQRHPDSLGKIPESLEQYRKYPHPGTDVSEGKWSFMKNPWQ